MVTYEDECIGCPTEMGCLGDTCPNKNVPHLYCDNCSKEVDELRDYNDEQWCEKCILDSYPTVNID